LKTRLEVAVFDIMHSDTDNSNATLMRANFLYVCTGCGVKLWPKPGDCCVFCSDGLVACPPIEAREQGTPSCCAG
jgi:hypothetical protein